MTDLRRLWDRLGEAQDAYAKGTPIMTDGEYETLWVEYQNTLTKVKLS